MSTWKKWALGVLGSFLVVGANVAGTWADRTFLQPDVPAPVLVYTVDVSPPATSAESSVARLNAQDLWDVEVAQLTQKIRDSVANSLARAQNWIITVVVTNVGEKPAESVRVELKFAGVITDHSPPSLCEIKKGGPNNSIVVVECDRQTPREPLSFVFAVSVRAMSPEDARAVAEAFASEELLQNVGRSLDIARSLDCNQAVIAIPVPLTAGQATGVSGDSEAIDPQDLMDRAVEEHKVTSAGKTADFRGSSVLQAESTTNEETAQTEPDFESVIIIGNVQIEHCEDSGNGSTQSQGSSDS